MHATNYTLLHGHHESAWSWSTPCTNFSLTTSNKISNFAVVYFTIPISIVASVSNITILYTLHKTPGSLSASSTLLAFLSLADLPVGLFVQPIFVLFCVHDMVGLCLTPLRIFHAHFAHVICGCSALMVAVISVDRCIHVSFPLRSRAWNLKRLYIYVICSSWLVLVILSSSFPAMTMRTFNILSFLFIACIIAVAITSYVLIYCTIRKTTRAVSDSSLVNVIYRQRLKRQKHASKMIRIIFAILFACYLPRSLLALIKQMTELDGATVYNFERWSAFFIFLNSAINPMVYCAGIKDIRTEVMGKLTFFMPKQRRIEVQAV